MANNLSKNLYSKFADEIYNNSPISIFIVNNSGIIKSANKSALALTGLSLENIIAKTIYELVPKTEMFFPKSWWQKVLKRNTNELLTSIKDSKFNEIPIKITAQFNIDSEFHLLYINKLSPLEKVSDELIKSEDKLLAYFNSTSELIVIINKDKIIVTFNRIFEQYVQMVYKAKVKEGDHIVDYITSETIDDFHKNFETAYNGNEVKLEREVFFQNSSIWWAITYLPVRNSLGQILGVAFVLQNIDEKKIAEDSLIKSEERFKLVIEGTNEGWWDWDLQTNQLFYSPKWWHILGYQNNELINIVNFWYKIVHPDDIDFVQSTFQNALASQVRTYEIEFKAKHKEGHFIPMLSRGYILRDENGVAIRVSGLDMDLTERKNNENLLIENQRKLQITQNLACIGNYEIDLINYSWKASSSIFEIIGAKINSIHNVNDFLNLIEPSYKDKVTAIYNRAFETYEPFTTEYQIIKLDNNEARWVIDLANFDLDNNGKPIRILGAIQDITERKSIENNLNKSEVKYRSLIENMDLGILEVDNNEIILKAYPKFCQMVGYTEKELIGKKATDIFLPKFEVDNFLNSTKARELGLSNAYEIQMYNKNKEIIHVIISGTPIFNEKSEVVGSIGIHYNISGRKQIEQELKESQETFEMIFSSSPTPLIITKPETGEIVLVNKAAINLLNLSENELVGKFTDSLFINNSDRNIIKNIIAEKGKVKDLEIKIKNLEQEILSCVLSIEVIDFKGKKMYLKSFTDITELKKIENELTNSFNLVNEQNKRLLNFSYIVSHNLRSHTSNIKSIVGFLGEEESESERLQLTSHLATVSDMLDETLNNLNDVLSIQKNVDLVLQDLKLSFYINKSLALLSEQIIKNEVHFDINIDDKLTIKFNAAYLESIIYNLISNAIKYRKPDIKPIIKISAEIENGKCVFSISDNGIGIDLKKNGEKLFGMYKTFHGNNDARGIGLFITKNQIEALGGKIDVRSKLGVGTTLIITFK